MDSFEITSKRIVEALKLPSEIHVGYGRCIKSELVTKKTFYQECLPNASATENCDEFSLRAVNYFLPKVSKI